MTGSKRPVYARVLRLRYLRPGGLLCFLFFEGSIALGVLLALAELAPWWGIVAIPVAVAVMVKLNDTVAANHARVRVAPAHVRPRARPGSGPVRPSVPSAREAYTPPPASRIPANGHGTPRESTEHDTRGDLRRGPNQGRFE